jgi:chromosome segregation ATPase
MTPEELVQLMTLQEALANAQAALAAEQAARAADAATIAQKNARIQGLQDDKATLQADVAAKAAQVQGLKDDKAALQLKVDDLQAKVAEWKALAAAPENASLSEMMRRIGHLKVKLDEAIIARDTAEGLLAAYRSDAERDLAAKQAQLDGLDAKTSRAEMRAMRDNLAALLDARCDKPRGHV